MPDLNDFSRRFGNMESDIENIRIELGHINIKLDKKNPSKFYVIVISVILIGVFGWLAVLTKIIAGG